MDRALQARLERDPVLRTATEWFLELRSDNVSGERIAFPSESLTAAGLAFWKKLFAFNLSLRKNSYAPP